MRLRRSAASDSLEQCLAREPGARDEAHDRPEAVRGGSAEDVQAADGRLEARAEDRVAVGVSQRADDRVAEDAVPADVDLEAGTENA